MKTKNKPRGWVFTDDVTETPVGFARAEEYTTADEAVDGFSNEYPAGFGVWFRDSNGKLNPCADESTPEDFP